MFLALDDCEDGADWRSGTKVGLILSMLTSAPPIRAEGGVAEDYKHGTPLE